MQTPVKTIVLGLLSLVLFAPAASAHGLLGTPLKAKYELRSVSCTACHLKESREKSKEDLTPFGVDIAKILEGKKVSERVEAAKDLESEERKKVYDEIEEEYTAALEKLDKMKAANEKLYEEALPAGDIEGTKPR